MTQPIQTRPPFDLLPGAIVTKAKILIEKIKAGKFDLEQSKLDGDILYLKLQMYSGYAAINTASNEVYCVTSQLEKTTRIFDKETLAGIWYYLASWTE